MNRRNFFKRFGGLIATVAIAQQLVRELVFDKVIEPIAILYKPNPQYVTAPFEIAAFIKKEGEQITLIPVKFKRSEGLKIEDLQTDAKFIRQTYPLRFDADGNSVCPQIEA